jgi:hypothetical protein
VTALGEHGGVGVEADRLLEEMREPDGEDAGTAAAVEEPAASVEPQLLGENGLELRRVGRPAAPVVGGGALVDRRVVRHRRRSYAVTKNGALEGAAFRRGRWFARVIGSYCLKL